MLDAIRYSFGLLILFFLLLKSKGGEKGKSKFVLTLLIVCIAVIIWPYWLVNDF